MASTYADFLRERLARERISPSMPGGGSSDQVYSVPSGGYGSLPIAPPPPEQARLAAAQKAAAIVLNAKLQQMGRGGGAATPQSQMTSPQLQAAGPGYGSQAARVANAPTYAPLPQPGIVPDIRKDSYGGLADLQAQQSAAVYVPPTPVTPTYSTTPVVPQSADIRLLESNVNLPMTAEAATASLQQRDTLAASEQYIADTQKRIDTRTQELIAQGMDPVRAQMIANQEVTDENVKWLQANPDSMPIANPLEVVGSLYDLYDQPRQAIVAKMGDGAYDVATGKSDSWSAGWAAIAPVNWMVSLPFTEYGIDSTRFSQDFAAWANDPKNAAIIRNAYENGFQSAVDRPRFTGGQAVWELFINSAGGFYKVFADALSDPTILFGAGKAGGEGLKTAALLDAAEGKGLKAAIKYGAGNIFSAPQTVLDASVDAPFNILGKGVGWAGTKVMPEDSAITRAIKSGFQSMFAPTDRQVATDSRELIQSNLTDWEKARIMNGGSGPGGTGSSGTPNGPVVIPPTYTPNDNPPGAGDFFKREATDANGNKTWEIVAPDGTVHSTGYEWKPRKGPEPNWTERQVQATVNELNRPGQVDRMTSAGIVVPPDSWGWADPTQYRLTSWGEERTVRDLKYAMTSDLRIPQETRQAMVNDLTPAVEAHVQLMNDIDADVTPGKKRAGMSGEDAIQSGRDIADPLKTMETVRFYAEDVLPVWQKHMGQLPENPYVFHYGESLNPKDVNNLIEHAMFGSNDIVTMVERNGKMVREVTSGTASQARRAIREMGGKVGGVPTTDVAKGFSEGRARLFGDDSLSQSASAMKSRTSRANAAAVPKEVKVEAAAVDMGAGKIPGGKTRLFGSRPPGSKGSVFRGTPNEADVRESIWVKERGHEVVYVDIPTESLGKFRTGKFNQSYGDPNLQTEYLVDYVTPKLVDAPSIPEMKVDPLIPMAPKKPGAKPAAQLNLQSDDASLRAAINNPDVLTKTPGGLRVRKDGSFTKVWSSSRKDANEPSVRIVETGNKYIVTTLGGEPIADSASLGESIAIADDWLLGRIGSPADVKAAKASVAPVVEPSLDAYRQPQRYPMARTSMGDAPSFVPEPKQAIQDNPSVSAADLQIGKVQTRVTKRAKGLDVDAQLDIRGPRGKVEIRAHKFNPLEGPRTIKKTDPVWNVVHEERGSVTSLVAGYTPAVRRVIAQDVNYNDALKLAKAFQENAIPDTSLGIVPASVRQSIEMDRMGTRWVQRKGGALTGQGVEDFIANRDSSPVGIALRRGGITQEAYQGLSRIVEWGGRKMPLYMAYEQLLQSGMTHSTAVDTLLTVLAPFPEMKKAKTWLGKWAQRSDRAYMGTLTVMRQQQQYNLANGAAKAAADQIGNAYTLLVTGDPVGAVRIWDPVTYVKFGLIERGNKNLLRSLPGMDRLEKHGITPPNGVLELNSGRTEVADGSEMALREFTKEVPILSGKPAGALYGVLANKTIKDFRNGGDRNSRFTHFMGRYFQEYGKARAKFYNTVRTRAETLGQDADEWVRLVKSLGDDFDNEDVLSVLGDERLSRDWREAVAKAKATAYKSVDDRLFSYRQLKIDEKLRYVVFYHYWLSRAMVLHSKTALKNPFLMNAYINLWQGLQQKAEDEGYPDSVIGTLRFMTDNAGFMSYIDPIGVVVPFDILTDKAKEDQGVADFLRNHGLFFNPIIDAALGVMGLTDRVSDLTQTRAVRRAIKGYVNWMNSNGYGKMIPDAIAEPNTLVVDPVEQISTRITQKANDALTSVPGMAGWAQEFSMPDGYEMDQVNSILMTQMEATFGPNSTWGESTWNDYLEAQEAILLHRDGNEYADAAIETFSDAQATTVAMNTIIPGGVQTRYGPRDAEIAAKNLGDQDAWDKRTLATTGSPGDATLTTGMMRLDQVGTEDGRWGYQMYNEIAYGDLPPGQYVIIGNEMIHTADVEAMSDGQRKELAQRWVEQYIDPTELESYRKERDLFLLRHPEVGDFKEFQKGVYGYDKKNGAGAWRAMFAKDHPEFADAMAAKEQRLRDSGMDPALIDGELDQWSASQESYKVANGIRDNAYDAPVDPKVPDYGFAEKDDPAASGGSTGTSQAKTPAEKTKDAITSYNDKIDKAVAVMNSAGYNVTAEDIIFMNPYYAQAFSMFDLPSMPYDANLFWQWKLLQPKGADVSIDAYLRVLEQSGQLAA